MQKMVKVIVKTLVKEGKIPKLFDELIMSRKKAEKYTKKINSGYLYTAEIIYKD